jgi:hypothetical protein
MIRSHDIGVGVVGNARHSRDPTDLNNVHLAQAPHDEGIVLLTETRRIERRREFAAGHALPLEVPQREGVVEGCGRKEAEVWDPG